jgi:hypothetical protein
MKSTPSKPLLFGAFLTAGLLAVLFEQLHWLLDGIDLAAVRRHPERFYRSMG